MELEDVEVELAWKGNGFKEVEMSFARNGND